MIYTETGLRRISASCTHNIKEQKRRANKNKNGVERGMVLIASAKLNLDINTIIDELRSYFLCDFKSVYVVICN